jgi:hypothetical protein
MSAVRIFWGGGRGRGGGRREEQLQSESLISDPVAILLFKNQENLKTTRTPTDDQDFEKNALSGSLKNKSGLIQTEILDDNAFLASSVRILRKLWPVCFGNF